MHPCKEKQLLHPKKQLVALKPAASSDSFKAVKNKRW
jgi:hypothetical protein